jgi:hypothetical protein
VKKAVFAFETRKADKERLQQREPVNVIGSGGNEHLSSEAEPRSAGTTASGPSQLSS